jgi:hypothetical protein
MAHDVFICYSSEDKVIADAACVKLEGAGIRCWIAPRDPIPGQPYSEQIVDAIAGCSILLLIFSEHANHSRAVLGEIELASNREKIILPFRTENVNPSSGLEFYIRSVHWLDAMNPPMEKRLDELTLLMRRVLTAAPTPERQAEKSATPSKPKTPLLAYGIGGAVLALFAIVFAFRPWGSNHESLAAASAAMSCAHPTYAADGNMEPLFCDTNAGKVDNPLALRYFAPMARETFPLGPDATPSQVTDALIDDYTHGASIPTLCSIYQLAAWKNHWSFGISIVASVASQLSLPSQWCSQPSL